MGRGRAAYSRMDIMQEMQRTDHREFRSYGYMQAEPTEPMDFGGAVDLGGVRQQSWNKSRAADSLAFAQASTAITGGSTGYYASSPYPSPPVPQQRGPADAYGGYDSDVYGGIPPHLLEGAVSFETREPHVISERVTETRQEFSATMPYRILHSTESRDQTLVRTMLETVADQQMAEQMREQEYREQQMAGGAYGGRCSAACGGSRASAEQRMLNANVNIHGVRPIYTVEKVVEVPHVITKEVEKHVPKPEIVERVVTVPKTEIVERTVKLPPRVEYKEQIVEVPETVVEERIVHVPRREVQERLIEVPKVRYVERLVYEDIIEYREVPVDKIVEVPEIEYVVKEVEQLVPQRYLQEYYVDTYKEVPVTQVQEVERIEYVPVQMPRTAGAGLPPTSVAWGCSAPQEPIAAPAVGSSFLVPRGTLPHGRLSTESAALASTSPVAGGHTGAASGAAAVAPAMFRMGEGFSPLDPTFSSGGLAYGAMQVPVQA
eukprot:CAMPEP_0170223706 /NCGR_PEP_ID=MMETSP0116_2-20130129/11553_1 /TAXON_ID=400756 /ORGANISM="Durinskia baltica, Strain CSIRO CS-38" /LENGTH=489 /DNA_ID=CAMNT_0010474409 /DNA_START=100 /DNA_END=1569 /DNA_ORIENTATION=+